MKIRMRCSSVERYETYDSDPDSRSKVILVDRVKLYAQRATPINEFGGVKIELRIENPELLGEFSVGKDYELTLNLDALPPATDDAR